jgi:hypothetical protein
MDALISIGDDRASVVLHASLRDQDAGVRRKAAILARVVLARETIGAITERLADPDADVRREAVRTVGALATPGTCQHILAALSRLHGMEAVVQVSLEATCRPQDLGRLLAAARHLVADTGDGSSSGWRPVVLRGLVAILPLPGERDRSVERDALDLLASELTAGGPTAEIAAGGAADLGRAGRYEEVLLSRFGHAPAPVRARLCVGLATSADGRARLGAVLHDRTEDDEVAAAAAWALAGRTEGSLRTALVHAKGSSHPAIAANAAAALGKTGNLGRQGSAPIVLRLRKPNGEPLAREWVRLTGRDADMGAETVWTRTDAFGLVTVFGLPREGVEASLANPGLQFAGLLQDTHE